MITPPASNLDPHVAAATPAASFQNDLIAQKIQIFMQAITSSLYQGRYMTVDSFDDSVTAFVTTRLGGQSKAPYDSFNVALHVGDDPNMVERNRQTMCDDYNLSKIFFMNQIHSKDVVVIDESNADGNDFTGDALVTKMRRVGLAVMTADCLPLLLCDEQERVIAAVHCGWKGLERGIVQETLAKMEELGASRHHIVGYMGPAIGPQSFEVGAEVRDLFIKQNEAFANAFVLHTPVTKAHVESETAPVDNSSDSSSENVFDILDSEPDEDHIDQEQLNQLAFNSAIAPAPALTERLKISQVAPKLEPKQEEPNAEPKEKYLCDIYQLCLMILRQSGCEGQIFCGGHFDTMAQYPVFYSYRHNHHTGRMATVISLAW